MLDSENQGDKKNFLEIVVNNKDREGLIKQALLDFIIRQSSTQEQYICPILVKMVSSLLPRDDPESEFISEDTAISTINELKAKTNTSISKFSRFHKVVYGVSHSVIYKRIHDFTVVHCGAGTMFSIGDPNSRTEHFKIIGEHLSTCDPANTIAVFEFGEVDLRNHIFRLSGTRGLDPHQLVDSAIDRYLTYLETVTAKGFQIIISAPHCGGGDERRIPHSATEVQRNDMCAYMNDKIAYECSIRGIPFCTLFDIGVSQKTLENIDVLYCDHHHFQQGTSIGSAISELGATRINYSSENYSYCNRRFQSSEITADCRIVVSNIPGWRSGLLFSPSTFCATIPKENPSTPLNNCVALIQLPFGMHIKDIVLNFNNCSTGVKSIVQGLTEPFDLSFYSKQINIINSFGGPLDVHSRVHTFGKVFNSDETCHFIILKLNLCLANAQLRSIKITRNLRVFN